MSFVFRLYLDALVDYMFPLQCQLCGRVLQHGQEEVICSWCLLTLPRTGFRKGRDHAAAQTFWGRCRFEEVQASLVYRRRNPAQKLIHQLKYHSSPETGHFLGRILGRDLLANKLITPGHVLVPVPLHPKKEKNRGYNQSRLISEGIRSICPAEVNQDVLFRQEERESQTKKGRFSRFTNSEGLFRLENPAELKGKHIILVDDVITTGATMEACAQLLSDIPGIRLSAAAVAFSGR